MSRSREHDRTFAKEFDRELEELTELCNKLKALVHRIFKPLHVVVRTERHAIYDAEEEANEFLADFPDRLSDLKEMYTNATATLHLLQNAPPVPTDTRHLKPMTPKETRQLYRELDLTNLDGLHRLTGGNEDATMAAAFKGHAVRLSMDLLSRFKSICMIVDDKWTLNGYSAKLPNYISVNVRSVAPNKIVTNKDTPTQPFLRVVDGEPVVTSPIRDSDGNTYDFQPFVFVRENTPEEVAEGSIRQRLKNPGAGSDDLGTLAKLPKDVRMVLHDKIKKKTKSQSQ